MKPCWGGRELTARLPPPFPAVGRGPTYAGLGHHPATRLGEHRREVQGLLLCAEALRRSAGVCKPFPNGLAVANTRVVFCSQLAYSNPRCRVLIFRTCTVSNTLHPHMSATADSSCYTPPLVADTGRLVGTGMIYCPLICLYTPPLRSLSNLYSMCVCVATGTGGAVAARLAIARAQRQLAEEANVHLHTRNFAVINRTCCLTLPSRDHLLTPLSISSTQRSARCRCGPLSTATPSPRSTRGSRTSTALLS